MTITQPSAARKIAVLVAKAAVGAALVAVASVFSSNPDFLGPYTAAVVLAIREVDNQFFA